MTVASVAVRCNVLQRVAVFQCVAICCSVSIKVGCRVAGLLQSLFQCVAVYHSVLQYITLCCSVPRCVAVYCSVLQVL